MNGSGICLALGVGGRTDAGGQAEAINGISAGGVASESSSSDMTIMSIGSRGTWTGSGVLRAIDGDAGAWHGRRGAQRSSISSEE